MKKVFNHIKKGEMYIDTAITVLISLFILYISISLFSFFNQYQNMKNLSNDLLKYCADKGYTSTADVEEKYKDLLKTYGLSEDEDKTAVKISFEGTEYYENSKVQLDDKIQLTIQSKYKIKLLSSDGINVYTMSITNAKNSNKYWKVSEGVHLNPNNHVTYVAKNATYQDVSENKTLLEDKKMPDVSENGDIYTYGDYNYVFDSSLNGWKVVLNLDVVDKNKATYGEILNEINNYPIISLYETFKDCIKMKESPIVPENVTTLYGTYEGCVLLNKAPIIPNNVKIMERTFYNCSSLVVAPEIPNGVETLKRTFSGCKKLSEAPYLPNSVTNMELTYYDCSKLITVPNIPNLVTTLRGTFGLCTSFVTAPSIPDTVTTMDSTFYKCSNLTTVISLPNKLTNMSCAFDSCTSLINVPDIPNSVTNMYGTFYGCTSLKNAPTIPNNVTNMDSTFYKCDNLIGLIKINASPSSRNNCFAGTKKPIFIVGNSSVLTYLASTSSAENITVHKSVKTIESLHSPYANNSNYELLGTWNFSDAKSVNIVITYETENATADWISLTKGTDYISGNSQSDTRTYLNSNGSLMNSIGTSSSIRFGGETKTTKVFKNINMTSGSVILNTDNARNNYYGVTVTIVPVY